MQYIGSAFRCSSFTQLPVSNLDGYVKKLTTMALFQLKNVLITDEIDAKCSEILQSNGINVVKDTSLAKDKARLLKEIRKYDGLIVRSATKVTADVIEASHLKIIGRAGTGVDNIDCDAATKKGVIVMNTPGGNTMSAAELTCTYVLAISRHIAAGTQSLRAGRWDRKNLMGNEVYGKTLGIVGLGRIGHDVATRMQAFGMTTIGFDPIIPAEEAAKFDTEWMTLDQMWPKCDYITVHTPLIRQTKNMINDEVFSKCKKGVKIINCARGGIVDEDALLRALNNGQCGGAGLDVFVDEPSPKKELLDHPLVSSTPHLGASTAEAQSRVAVDIAQQFVDMVNGKSLFGALNAQAMTNALSPSSKSYVNLGQTLGALASSLLGQVNSQTKARLITEGASLKEGGSYMKVAALVGLLKAQSQNGLNLVSAPACAKQVGLEISNEHNDKAPEGLKELVSLVVAQGGDTYKVSGAVGADGNPVLVGINDLMFSQGTKLDGQMLVYKSSNSQSLSGIVGKLAGANSDVLAYSKSNPDQKGSWHVMQISEALQNTDVLNDQATLVRQFEI